MGKDKILDGLPTRKAMLEHRDKARKRFDKTARDGQIPLDEELILPLAKSQDEGFLAQLLAKSPRFTISTFPLMLLLMVGFALLTFVSIRLPSPLAEVYPDLDYVSYSFQIPTALFLGAFLGAILGGLTVLTFVLAGLFAWPVFANGGGLEYIQEPGMGYLIGMVIGAFVAGRLFRQVMRHTTYSKSSLAFLITLIPALAVVHLSGIVYMLGLTLAGVMSFTEAQNWMFYLSTEPLLYDAVIGLLLLVLVRPLRACLWFALY